LLRRQILEDVVHVAVDGRGLPPGVGPQPPAEHAGPAASPTGQPARRPRIQSNVFKKKKQEQQKKESPSQGARGGGGGGGRFSPVVNKQLSQGEDLDFSDVQPTEEQSLGSDTLAEKREICLVTLSKRSFLKDNDVQRLKTEMAPLVQRSEIPTIIIDFNRVTEVSSSFVGFLISISRHICRRGGEVHLCSLSEDVEDVFRLSGLHLLVNIYADIQEAIRETTSEGPA
jgi:anti-anti-sigma factor